MYSNYKLQMFFILILALFVNNLLAQQHSELFYIENNVLKGCNCEKIPADGKIKIPYFVKMIEKEVFKDCNQLQFVEIPNTVEIIEERAFFNCIYNHRTTKTNQKYPSVNL
ncbi:hypothetical protein CAPN010_15850 [Capnocytophaga cynodegmi]|uniref:leucine-rich repeat protein n=1 Tax=Capnocytophaga cynodegmi TaxID=28189 RepID=UPI001EE31FDD|nr:leucine-rich repeat protein [Capnocytophaga cynodegmi]GJQ07427.1 hypothetical protein CAPN010_15850 [Capnocytophaga cynodegmi]